jgi:hypothetical protein
MPMLEVVPISSVRISNSSYASAIDKLFSKYFS